ncbi:MAG: hypothetical protein EXR86_07940 [Gammaproteobacteria bacterium]|nr:hypothetical protein [Gammaproteobacteria bacterium]
MSRAIEETDDPDSSTHELASAFGAAGSSGLYISPTLQQRLDLIEHLIEFGRQIILLNGSDGSGKSALIGYFAAGQRLNWYSIRVQAGPTLTAAGIKALLAQELDVEIDSTDSPEHLANATKQRITALERAGKIPVLLVDDADQLLPEAISAIVRLAHTPEQQAELRVLMAADLDRAPVREALQREYPQHGLVHVVEIPRLTEAQVRALITQRMENDGLSADEHFGDLDYRAIAQAADGVAGTVLTLARQHLLGREPLVRQPLPRLRKANKALWPRAALVIVAGVALALGVWWARYKSPTVPSISVKTVELPMPEAAPKEEEKAITEGVGDAPGVTLELPVSSVAPAAPPSAEQPPQLPPEVAASPATEAPTPATKVPDLVPLESPVPPAPSVDMVPQPDTPRSTLPVAPKTPTKVASRESPPKPKPRPVPAPISTSAPPIAQFSVGWLLKQPASGHTLQLFGVSERRAAERFISQRGIAQQTVILTTALKGKPWYIVAYGYYPTRAAALAVLAKPPATLRDTEPWARSIGSLRTIER